MKELSKQYRSILTSLAQPKKGSCILPPNPITILYNPNPRIAVGVTNASAQYWKHSSGAFPPVK